MHSSYLSHVFLLIVATTVCSTGSSCGQPVPTSTKWVLILIFCIIVTRNGLNTKRSLHSRLNFMFLVQLLISLWLVMTCVIPSQMAYSFIISSASHSMHCSSVEAYLLWKCCSVSHRIVLISGNRMLLMFQNCYICVQFPSNMMPNRWHGIFYLYKHLWQEICAINAQNSYSKKTAVKVILSMWSLVSIKQQSPRRPCDISLQKQVFFVK